MLTLVQGLGSQYPCVASLALSLLSARWQPQGPRRMRLPCSLLQKHRDISKPVLKRIGSTSQVCKI